MKLSVEAVLEIAQKIEHNAVTYYEKAAECFPAYKKELLSIKKMEEAHEKLFLKMQDSLDEKQRSTLSPDPFGELDTYLQAFADSSGGEGRLLEFHSFTGKESFHDVISRSIELEKESILFYRKIERIVDAAGAGHIDAIVEEENRHIKLLGGYDGR